MNKIKPILFLISIILFSNLFGFLLKHFELSTYIIILGFRFHLIPILIFLGYFIFVKDSFHSIKSSFIAYQNPKILSLILTLIIPAVVILIAGLIINKIKIGDPDYFYELGLSSIVDFPIYFLWNLPQLILIYSFYLYLKNNFNLNFILIFLFTISVALFEFIDLNNFKFAPINFLELFLFSIAVALVTKKNENAYSISFFIFGIIWVSIICFGTNSLTLTNILLAKNFEAWDGFFIVEKSLRNYTMSLYFLVVSLILLFFSNSKK
ncbi:MAG: hypothetical protein C0425_06610 [Chlorobiaceae bacterium]|nr:hypothetical protein [Chlorobiaceae bacterium]MBA4309992.1 hypothetical protein [Chlorobiaceae bacterium]